jgi:hypothetical protein
MQRSKGVYAVFSRHVNQASDNSNSVNRKSELRYILSPPPVYAETKIGDYHAAHDISRPLAELRGTNLDNALVEVCQNIKAAVSL